MSLYSWYIPSQAKMHSYVNFNGLFVHSLHSQIGITYPLFLMQKNLEPINITTMPIHIDLIFLHDKY